MIKSPPLSAIRHSNMLCLIAIFYSDKTSDELKKNTNKNKKYCHYNKPNEWYL